MKNQINKSLLLMILSVLLIFASNISANRKSIDVIRINDPITPVISEYVISSINAAEKSPRNVSL